MNNSTPHIQRQPTRQLSDEALQLIVTRLRVLAEPTRIRLLEHLNSNDATVQTLADLIGTTRQNVSKHLGILHQAGMLSRRRDGTSIYYSLVDWSGWWLVEQIGASVTAHLDELRQAFDAPPPGLR